MDNAHHAFAPDVQLRFNYKLENVLWEQIFPYHHRVRYWYLYSFFFEDHLELVDVTWRLVLRSLLSLR